MLPRSKVASSARPQATAAIKHDHIVTIYQVGRDNDVLFLAMEYLQGLSLQSWLERGASHRRTSCCGSAARSPPAWPRPIGIGLIHRDIKPANIWLEAPSGRVKILDFGMARSERDDVQITQAGHRHGHSGLHGPGAGPGRGSLPAPTCSAWDVSSTGSARAGCRSRVKRSSPCSRRWPRRRPVRSGRSTRGHAGARRTGDAVAGERPVGPAGVGPGGGRVHQGDRTRIAGGSPEGEASRTIRIRPASQRSSSCPRSSPRADRKRIKRPHVLGRRTSPRWRSLGGAGCSGRYGRHRPVSATRAGVANSAVHPGAGAQFAERRSVAATNEEAALARQRVGHASSVPEFARSPDAGNDSAAAEPTCRQPSVRRPVRTKLPAATTRANNGPPSDRTNDPDGQHTRREPSRRRPTAGRPRWRRPPCRSRRPSRDDWGKPIDPDGDCKFEIDQVKQRDQDRHPWHSPRSERRARSPECTSPASTCPRDFDASVSVSGCLPPLGSRDR